MEETPDRAPDAAAAASLRLLRRLVTGLTAVMIIGVIVVVGLMVTRLNRGAPLPLPDSITLPDGARATAVTVAPRWFLVVTEDAEVLVFDRDSGKLLQSVELGQ